MTVFNLFPRVVRRIIWALVGVASVLAIGVIALGIPRLHIASPPIQAAAADYVAIGSAVATAVLAAATYLIVLQNRRTRLASLKPNLSILMTSQPSANFATCIDEGRGPTILIQNYGPGIAEHAESTFYRVNHSVWVKMGRPRDPGVLESIDRDQLPFPFAGSIYDVFGVGPRERVVFYSDAAPPNAAYLGPLTIGNAGLIRLDLDCTDTEGAALPTRVIYFEDLNFGSKVSPRITNWRMLASTLDLHTRHVARRYRHLGRPS